MNRESWSDETRVALIVAAGIAAVVLALMSAAVRGCQISADERIKCIEITKNPAACDGKPEMRPMPEKQP